MNKATHSVIAVTAATSIAMINRQDPTFMGVVEWVPFLTIPTSLLGGLLIDVDIEGSTIGNRFPFLAKHLTHRGITHMLVTCLLPLLLLLPIRSASTTILARFFVALALMGIVTLTMSLWEHKLTTLIHHIVMIVSALYLVVYTAVGNILPIFTPITNSIVIGVVIGALSHLLYADVYNKKGIPGFAPLITDKVHIMRIKTGSWEEPVFCFVTVIGIALHTLLILGGKVL